MFYVLYPFPQADYLINRKDPICCSIIIILQEGSSNDYAIHKYILYSIILHSEIYIAVKICAIKLHRQGLQLMHNKI